MTSRFDLLVVSSSSLIDHCHYFSELSVQRSSLWGSVEQPASQLLMCLQLVNACTPVARQETDRSYYSNRQTDKQNVVLRYASLNTLYIV